METHKIIQEIKVELKSEVRAEIASEVTHLLDTIRNSNKASQKEIEGNLLASQKEIEGKQDVFLEKVSQKVEGILGGFREELTKSIHKMEIKVTETKKGLWSRTILHAMLIAVVFVVGINIFLLEKIVRTTDESALSQLVLYIMCAVIVLAIGLNIFLLIKDRLRAKRDSRIEEKLNILIDEVRKNTDFREQTINI
jgi:hypothetical protein